MTKVKDLRAVNEHQESFVAIVGLGRLWTALTRPAKSDMVVVGLLNGSSSGFSGMNMEYRKVVGTRLLWVLF